MLSAFMVNKPQRHSILAGILAISLCLPAVPALALDRHEQGIVAGAVGVLLLQGLIRHENARSAPQPPRYVPPQYVPPHYAPAPVPATPAAYAFGSYSFSERRAIQRSLARAGYYYGAIDGAFGRGTYRATAAFAQDIGAGASLNTQAGAYSIYDRLLYGL